MMTNWFTWVHHFINGLEIRLEGSKEENFKGSKRLFHSGSYRY
jgi:hypothetical protein